MSEKRAPVFFTIAALQHEPLANLSLYAPLIQDDLRKRGFAGPYTIKTVSADTTGMPQGAVADALKNAVAQQSYTISTIDRTSAFTFNSSGVFSFHTTDYVDRATLFENFKLGLEVLHRHAQLQSIIRVGMRMLDLIRPAVGSESLEDYVKPGLLGFRSVFEPNDWTAGLSTLEHHFLDENAEVIAKFDCLPDGFGINADLFDAISLHALPKHLTDSSRQLHAILDIDSGTRQLTSELKRKFEIEVVMTELKQHKDRISKLFKAAVTPHALSRWGLSQ